MGVPLSPINTMLTTETFERKSVETVIQPRVPGRSKAGTTFSYFLQSDHTSLTISTHSISLSQGSIWHKDCAFRNFVDLCMFVKINWFPSLQKQAAQCEHMLASISKLCEWKLNHENLVAGVSPLWNYSHHGEGRNVFDSFSNSGSNMQPY